MKIEFDNTENEALSIARVSGSGFSAFRSSKFNNRKNEISKN